MAFVDCYTLPAPSTSSISGVRLDFPGGVLTLRFDYEKDGAIFNMGLIFRKVRALSHVAELHCPAEKIEQSYDKLIQLSDSEWVGKLKRSTPDDQQHSWKLNHYMIYFDADGCFEIVAESWETLQETPGACV